MIVKSKIAILITCYNRKEKTLACLEALFNNSIPKNVTFDIFLVDDGSTDGTSESVYNKYSEVKIIPGNGELFWNRGMHLAWQIALECDNYNYFLWLNDDTILTPHALQVLTDTSLNFNNKAIIVGTTCHSTTNNLITYGGRDKNGTLIKPLDYPVECSYFNGNLVLVPDNVFHRIGTIDPYFRHTLGDFDYGLRAIKAGIKLIVSPQILGYCENHKQLPAWCNTKTPFSKRWALFRSPLGQNPEEYFIFEKRHRGICMALFHYFTNHLRVLFPRIWSFR